MDNILTIEENGHKNVIKGVYALKDDADYNIKENFYKSLMQVLYCDTHPHKRKLYNGKLRWPYRKGRKIIESSKYFERKGNSNKQMLTNISLTMGKWNELFLYKSILIQ